MKSERALNKETDIFTLTFHTNNVLKFTDGKFLSDCKISEKHT